MSLLTDVKILLRISNVSFDVEIQDLIDACKSDLQLSGVNESILDAFIADPNTDKLLKRAFNTYVKANFGWDNPDVDKLTEAYNMLKNHLTLSTDYSFFTVTIDTAKQQEVIFDGCIKETDETGTVVFFSKGGNHLKYVVDGTEYYTDVTEDVIINVV